MRQHDLRMAPDQMLDLAQMAAELLVERSEHVSAGDAWDGEFREGLATMLMEEPPEEGLPAKDVLERAAREILPYAARHDHPRFFGFIPSSTTWPGVIADFMAAGHNINAVTWLAASGPSQVELVVMDWFRRWLGYPEGAAGLFTSRLQIVVDLAAAQQNTLDAAVLLARLSEDAFEAARGQIMERRHGAGMAE